MKKRIISILLTACMLVCLIPTGAFAADSTGKQYPAIHFDTKPMSNPTKVQNGNNIHFEPNSYIYFGDNGGEPIKWRVLDTEKANDGSKNGMFLMSEYLLDNNVKYNYIHGTSEYSGSDGQQWCKDFAANAGHFSELEREAMLSVQKTDNVEKTLFDYTWDKCSLTDADKMFFPSIREVIDYIGNYDQAPGFIATDTSGNKGTWWLRSHPSGFEKGAGLIYDTGFVDVDNVNTAHSARPAFNLNKNNIAFISAAAGGKSAEGTDGGLVEIPAYSGNEWKLTLYDSSRSDFYVDTKAVSVTTDGGEISISYGHAKNGRNEYISAILFDQDGNAKYYGRNSVFSDPIFSYVGGSRKFQIPAGLAEGEYNFVVFSEQYNGDYKTDYISDLHSVRFTVEKKTAEQFSLATGERYYFDLSSFEFPGTTNSELPDSTLRYVPFIYAGTVNSYVLTTESWNVKGSSEYASKITDPSLSLYGYTYPHSLFIAEHTIKTGVMWYELQRASCIYGADYQSGGIDYTMRAPTVGSAGNSNDGGVPLRNEWDRILDKNSNFIKNWKDYGSWGQDLVDSHEGVDYSVRRGEKNSVRNWADTQKSRYGRSCCYRPVLEVKNADALGRNGLRAVTLNFNGTTVGGEEEIKIVVKGGGSFTAPTTDGIERPYGWNYFGWLGDNNRVYAPGDSVPEYVTSLTAQWIEPEEFHLEYGVGNTYYFDLSGEEIPGTVDGDLPDTSLHYVPFTYVGTIEAYKLKSSSIGVVEAAKIASEVDYPDSMYGYTQLHSLFIADRTLTNRVSWKELDEKGLIFGRDYTSNGINYTMRAPSMGSSYDESWNNLPANNEWDRILAKASWFIKNMGIQSGKDLFFYWGQDTRINDNGTEYMVLRYEKMIGNRQKNDGTDGAYRPVLEVQNAAALGSDGLKEVVLYLAGGSLDGRYDINLMVKNGESFTAPSKEGLVPPSDNLVFAGWQDGQNFETVYQPGDSVPSTVTWLNATWETHNHCICGGNAYDGHDSHENVDWKPWTATDSLPDEAGNYFLMNNVTLSSGTVTLPDGLNICLNGNSIKGKYMDSTKLELSGTLGITDCSGEGSVGEMTLIGNSAKFTMYGGNVAESTFLIISGGAAFTMTGKAQNSGFIRILDDADFTMNGDSENNSTIYFVETDSDSRIKFGGHAKGGNVFFESTQYGPVISLDGSAEIPSLSGILANIALSMKDDAIIGSVSNVTFTGLSLSGNAKVGSEDSVFEIESRNILLKDNVQLIGKITYGAYRESGTLTLQDKASISGELTISNDGGEKTPIKVIMNGDSAVNGNLVCSDEAVSFEMQDNTKINGNIDVANSAVLGTVTCGGDIISGVFDQNGTVVNNGRIVGGIFYGTVIGTGTIEDSAKRAVSFVPNGGTLAANKRTVDILRGQKVGVPTGCNREGYTLTGWNKGDEAYDFSTPVLEEIALTAQWTANVYTVKFDTNAGSAVADKTLGWNDKVLEGIETPRRNDGYVFVSWMCDGKAIDNETTYAALAENDKVESLTLTAQWRDAEKPTGEIIIKDNVWNKLLNSITFGLFFKETQTVTITASDNSGDNVTIMYMALTKASFDRELTEEELEKEGFDTYNGSFNISPDDEYVIYAKLMDEAGNTSYICSDGIVLDGTAPVISGIEDGKTYCQAQTVTVTEEYVGTVKVNGTEVTLDGNGSFTLSPAEGEQKIIVTDKAGNTAEMTVTVNDGHTAGQDDGDCTTPIYCIYHSDVVVVEAKQHDFSGEWEKDQSGHWHACQNDGCTVTDSKATHSGKDDGDCTTAVNCEVCGFEIKAAEESHDFSGEWLKDESGHWHACQNENCTVTETKAAHNGEDDGDCTTAVNCEACGAELKAAEESHNFSNEWEKDQSDHWHACQNDGCTVTDSKTAHSGEDDGDCTTALDCETCGAELKAAEKEHSYGEYVQNADGSDTHTRNCLNDGCKHTETGKCFGGKATCESRAICEACGKPYGELDKNNHSHLDRVDGKNPTEDTDGNSEYWHCDGCGKYYDDETAVKEISKADTIIEKLPKAQPEGENESDFGQNSDKSGAPKTGDGTSPFMWIALFFVSGGIAAALYRKKALKK